MNVPKMESYSVGAVLEELLVTREGRGVSVRWLYSLENTLCRFADFCPGALASVSPADCEGFLRSLNLAPRSRNNVVQMLRQLFRFAVRRRYVPADFLPLATLELSLVRDAPAQLYAPVEVQRILDGAAVGVRPVIALTAFCGVRWAEAVRLAWGDLKPSRACLFVEAGKAKTASRRVCPLPENALAWIHQGTPVGAEGGGRVWPGSEATAFRALAAAVRAAGVTPRQNGLRHSFISYRLALVQDAAKVALEAGTSPQMIFSNYRELVTPDEARAWFAVRPPSGQLELGLRAA